MNPDRAMDIICPVYNGGDAFAETLRSLLAITQHDDLTLIVSDNHSRDGSPWRADLQVLQSKGWRTREVSPPDMLGRIAHWTWALQQGNSPFVKPLFVGDTILPAFAEVMPGLMDEHHAAMGCCQSVTLRPDKDVHPNETGRVRSYSHREFIDANLRHANIVGPLSAVIFRRSALTAALPFEDAWPWAADWRLYLRLSEHGKIFVAERNMIHFNQKANRLSTQRSVIMKSLIEEFRVTRELSSATKRPFRGTCRAVMNLLHSMIIKYGRSYIPDTARKPLGRLYGSLLSTKRP